MDNRLIRNNSIYEVRKEGSYCAFWLDMTILFQISSEEIGLKQKSGYCKCSLVGNQSVLSIDFKLKLSSREQNNWLAVCFEWNSDLFGIGALKTNWVYLKQHWGRTLKKWFNREIVALFHSKNTLRTVDWTVHVPLPWENQIKSSWTCWPVRWRTIIGQWYVRFRFTPYWQYMTNQFVTNSCAVPTVIDRSPRD